MATIGALVFEMSANVARLQSDMAKARSTVEGAMAGIQSAAKLATTALGAIGVGASLAGFESMIKGATESMNALHELSLRTGATVEQLSALRGVAKAAGTDMDTVASLTNRLEKNMLEFARGGGGKAAGAFQELGISVDQAKKALEGGDIAGFMQMVAQKLAGMESGAQRAAYAQELMGKSGAALLPFLMELSKTGELNAKVTTEQAEAAHQLEVNMGKLQGQSNKLKMEIANALIPSLNDITQAMLDARRAGDGFFGAMFEGAKRAFSELMKWNNAGDLARISKEIVDLTDKWMGLEKMQGTRGITAERVAGVKAELDALIKKRQTLEGIAQIEQGGGVTGKKEAPRTALVEIAKKENAEKEKGLTLEDLLAKAAMKRLQLQDAAEAEATRQAEAAAAAVQRMNEQLDAQAEKWRDLIDPQRQYGRQMEELMKLYESGRITVDEWNKAAAVINQNAENAAGMVGKIAQETKKSNDFMKDLGFVMVSGFEDAIAKGKSLRDVIQGMGQDIAKILTRKLITDPLGNAASDALKSSGIGDIFGGLFKGGGSSQPELLNSYAVGTDYVPYDQVAKIHQGERIVPASQNSGGGGGVTINFNVTAIDSSSFNSKIAQSRQLIVGIVQDAFTRGGRVSGMVTG